MPHKNKALPFIGLPKERSCQLQPLTKGKVDAGPRQEFFYFSDNADLMAVTFKTVEGNLFTGKPDLSNVPYVTNLRADPWERYQSESMLYGKWWGEKLWAMLPATMIVGEFLNTFKEFPPSQISGSLGVEQALAALQDGSRKN